MFSDGDCGCEIDKDGFVPCIELRKRVKFHMKDLLSPYDRIDGDDDFPEMQAFHERYEQHVKVFSESFSSHRQANLTSSFLGSIWIVYGNFEREGMSLGQVSNIEVTSPSTATITCIPKSGYFSVDHVRRHIEKTFLELGESVDIEEEGERILYISAPDQQGAEYVENVVSQVKESADHIRLFLAEEARLILKVLKWAGTKNNMEQIALEKSADVNRYCEDVLRKLDEAEASKIQEIREGANPVP
jgi:ribosome recycling factor